MNFVDFFQYGFLVRGLEAGLIVALVAPLIGIFLVLRRYSLIADTLSHVSLAGVAIGFITGINPMLTALAASLVASLGIERLRFSGKISGETALSLFLSGSLALATVLLSLGKSMNASLLNYLFGSINTVTSNDVLTIGILAIVSALGVALFYKELVATTFDETLARVSGIPAHLISVILIALASLVIALSIPIVGVLLISALIVIPVTTALQLRVNFTKSLLFAELFSVLSVIIGIGISFAYDLSTGGTIVLVMLAIFLAVFLYEKTRS